MTDFKNPFNGLSPKERDSLWEKLGKNSKRTLNFHEVDGILKPMGLDWAKWAREIEKDPSNFKRQFKGYVDRMNVWLEPLGLEVLIAPKSEGGEEKNKRKAPSKS